MRVRSATMGDLPQVRELFGALHAYNASFDERFRLSDDWPALLEDLFSRTVDAPDRLWALAWDGDEAVGLIVGESHLDPPLFRSHPWLELSALYVRPSHRRLRVAALLVDHLEEWASAHGHDTIQLYVTAANVSARDFYARQGYELLQEIWRKKLPPAEGPASAASPD